MEIRKQFDINRGCCDFNLLQALRLTAREAIGGVTYPSEIGQDKWVIGKMFPGVTDGFFLDVGSGHGTIGSNTKALEDLGWTGICVDPFPTHMEGRTCRMEKVVVSSAAGQVVKFHTHAGLGGIADTLGKWKEEAAKESGRRVHDDDAGGRARAPPTRRRSSTSSVSISRAPSSRRSAACRSTSIDSARWPSSTTTKSRSEPIC